MRSHHALFHTKIGKNLSAFGNWNFSSESSPRLWDSIDDGFWYADSTTLLVWTVKYSIGDERLQNAYLSVQPEKTIHKKRIVTNRILGIPVSYADKVEEKLLWQKTVVVNDEAKVPKRKRGFMEMFNTTTSSNII